MNYLDYIIVVVVAFFTVKGLLKGFVNQVLGFFGLLMALVLATKYMSDVAETVDNFLNIPPALATLLAYLLIFVATILAFQVLNHVLQKAVKVSFLHWVDKTLGLLVGALKGGVIMSLIFLLISIIPLSGNLIPGLNDSKLFRPTKTFAPKVFNFIMSVVPNSKSFYAELKESFDKFSVSELGQHTRNFLKSIEGDEDSE